MKYGEITDVVLEAIADGLIAGWKGYPRGFRLPVVLGEIIKYILEKKKKKIKESKIKRVLNNLEKREIVSLDKKKDEIYVHVTEKGKEKVLKYSLKLLLDFKKKEKKWLKKWFMVIFDVPEAQKNKREYLRRFLKWLGFYRYQKSVYIFPYECEKEVELIKKIVEGEKYIKYVITEKVESEESLKTFFGL